MTSADFTCYDTATNPTASTVTVSAGDTIGIQSDGTIYHPGVSFELLTITSSNFLLTIVQTVNVYMAKAPSDATSFDGLGAAWFKVWRQH